MRATVLALTLILTGCSGDAAEGDEPGITLGEPEVLPTVIEDAQTGDPGLLSADSLFFAPAGHLVIGDGAADRLVIVNTRDVDLDASTDDWERLSSLESKLADAMGATELDVTVEDIAVNPRSGRTYVAATRRDTDFAGIFTVLGDKSVAMVDLASLEWVAVAYPEVSGAGSVVTDVSATDDWIVAAVTEPGWTPSQVVTVALPVRHDDAVAATSTNTYHRSHRQWETSAPITTLFTVTDDDGQDWVGASYQCAPVVRFPIEDLAAGDAETLGETPYDYGGGRQVTDFLMVGEGEEAEVMASVSNLGGTRVERSLFLATNTENLDEGSPVVFAGDRSPDHNRVAAAPKLDDVDAFAVLDAARLVRWSSSGVLEIIDTPQ